ncbi:MAG: hypothetical protein P8X79_16705 [Reinekea sp.]
MGNCFSISNLHLNILNPMNREARVGTEYKSLSEVNDQRLDALVGRRNGQVINVSTTTFELMKQAHEVLREVGFSTFPDGPGNQEAAIWASKGVSNGRMLMARTSNRDFGYLSPGRVSVIKRAGGGSCAEHMAVTTMELFRRKNTVPIFNVYESNIGHNITVMGDWRDRTIGDQAVVVDAWQGLKKIYTYGERINTVTPEIEYVLPLAKDMPPVDSAIRKALATKPVSERKIINYMKSSTMVNYGREGAIDKILELRNINIAYSSITGTNNIHTAYRSPNGEQSEFNSTPKQYLQNYLRAREEIDNRIPR